MGRRRGRPISRYVPTISGLADLAIYRDLKRVFKDAVDELPPLSTLLTKGHEDYYTHEYAVRNVRGNII